jgi:butyryl-CoA dehydrogenase
MEMASYIVIAWQWLKMAHIAKEKIEAEDFKINSKLFYEGKIHTMQFFFKYELPHADACAETLLNTNTLTNIQNLEMFF